MRWPIMLNAGVFVLLLVLTIEAAGMSRSLIRIEHEERRLVTHCVAERPTIGLGAASTVPLLQRFEYIPADPLERR
jgi:hypothetical protein